MQPRWENEELQWPCSVLLMDAFRGYPRAIQHYVAVIPSQRERERRHRTTDCDMLSCVCCCFYLQHLIYVHIIILHIQILSKSYAVYSICVRIISKYIYLKILILEVTSSGLFQTHNAIILLPIKPLLQRLAHLAPWEAESIQEIAEEFQYLWLHIQCAETMACVCVFLCANIHIYLGTQMTRLCWLDFVPCFRGWQNLQKRGHSQVPHFSSAFYEGTGKSRGKSRVAVCGISGVFHIWKREKIPTLGPWVYISC